MSDKKSVIIAVGEDWDHTSETLYFQNKMKYFMKNLENANVSKLAVLNRFVTTDLTLFNFKYLDKFEDVVIRSNNGYMSLRDLYNNREDGAGYTDRYIELEHDLVKLYLSGGLKLKPYDNYISEHGMVRIIIDTFINIFPTLAYVTSLAQTLDVCSEEIEVYLDNVRYDQNRRSMRLTLRSFDDNDMPDDIFYLSYELNINTKHINYCPIKLMVEWLNRNGISAVVKNIQNYKMIEEMK